MADDVDEEDGKRSIENDLKYGVDGNENSTVLVVTTSKSSPNQHLSIVSEMCICNKLITYHSNASRKANEDQALTKFAPVGKESPGESKLFET